MLFLSLVKYINLATPARAHIQFVFSVCLRLSCPLSALVRTLVPSIIDSLRPPIPKMETATFLQNSFGTSCGTSSFGSRSDVFTCNGVKCMRFGPKSSVFTSRARSKKYDSLSHFNLDQTRLALGRKKFGVIRASSSEPLQPAAAIAPLRLESPVGQFLSQILISHPHLVPAAVEQQLEQLQTDREAEKKDEFPASGTDIVLYRRIAEVKANERRKALEEILYALVVQKFMDADVSLVPSVTISSADQSGLVDTWPSQDDKLKGLHSPESYEMIQNHLALILGNRLDDLTSVAQISKLRVGQVYAASVMYGYFLRRVDQRFQLEKTMKILPQGSGDEEFSIQQAFNEVRNPNTEDSLNTAKPHPEVSSWASGISPGGFGHGIKSSRLRNYVMSFDGETLQRYATIRSKEAVSIIEKHTEALFGRPEIVVTPLGTIDSSSDENIKISFRGLHGLILEAVTFGSFLWDVESYVDLRYHFVAN